MPRGFNNINVDQQYLVKDMPTLKVLGGIYKGVFNNSLALQLSKSHKFLDVKGDIATKRVRILIPFASGVMNFDTLMEEYLANGAIKTDGINLGEQEVQIGYEAITIPQHWRPKVGEQLNAAGLLDRYKSFQVMSMVKHIDTNAWWNVVYHGINGVKLKDNETYKTQSKVRYIKKEELSYEGTKDQVATKAYNLLVKIRNDIGEIVEYEDLTATASFNPNEMVIISRPRTINLIKNEIRYNIYNSYAASQDGIGGLKLGDTIKPVGNIDGVNVYTSKFLPEGVEMIIMVIGTFKELFRMFKYMNFDKVGAMNLFKFSLEYQGGTGVFSPHLMTIYCSEKTLTVDKWKYVREQQNLSDKNKPVEQGKMTDGNKKYTITITEKGQERRGFRKIDVENHISPNFYNNMDERVFAKDPTPTT
ncbi:MAG: hypothetical protein E7Y34_02020, partial [Mycoplasma sp.]|nr:hypothetical protein [Mycoplasma sp.]